MAAAALLALIVGVLSDVLGSLLDLYEAPAGHLSRPAVRAHPPMPITGAIDTQRVVNGLGINKPRGPSRRHGNVPLRPPGMTVSWRRVRLMPTFVLRLIAPRPNFAQTLTDSEREIMNSHAAHWRPYLERGEMVVFGPVLTDEDSYGLAVVETGDEQALREFAAQDPVVTTGTAAFELGRLAAGHVRGR
jgi:uncharacterized protein YciI